MDESNFRTIQIRQMTTLHDLKRLLDEGETLVGYNILVWKSPKPNHYYVSDGLRTNEYDWQMIEKGILIDPSNWHQRNQIGADKPVAEPPLKGPDVLMEQVMEAYSKPYKPLMVVVDAKEWEALQTEIAELRRVNVSLIQQLRKQVK